MDGVSAPGAPDAEIVAAWITAENIEALFDAHGVPCGPINDYADAFADPQIRAREMVVQIDHPTLGYLQTLGSPIKMSETPPVVARRAPLLGEHTREVLREVGYSEEEISTIMTAGIGMREPGSSR
jgi:crotonobetainyl-CoA:carnitine CoA-transferase CaiB-like acyl-CoA transferase